MTLSIKPKGAAKENLADTGRTKVKVKVTYTPTGGESSKETKRVTLKKR